MREGPADLRITPDMVRLVEDWNRVYAVYARQDWLGTLDALQEFAVHYPDDVVAGIYLSRVIGFVLEPPSPIGTESSISARSEFIMRLRPTTRRFPHDMIGDGVSSCTSGPQVAPAAR